MASCRTYSGVSAVLGLAALALGGACSDDNLDARFMPRERFASAYAQALCSSLEHCCNQNAVRYAQTECSAGWKSVVEKILANPYLAGNYQPQLGTECLNEVLAAKSTTCDPLPGSISAARDACQAVFFGRKAVGELCSSPLECAPVPDNIVTCQGFPIPNPDKGLLPLSSAAGEGRPYAVLGGAELEPMVIPSQRTCVAYPVPSGGSSCASADLKAICEQDGASFCDPADKLCKTRGDLGGACTITSGCKAGLYCTALACSPGQGVGAACAASPDCDSFLYCAGGSSTCVDKKRPGDACSLDEECSVGVCDLQTNRCLANGIATSEACTGTDPATVTRR